MSWYLLNIQNKWYIWACVLFVRESDQKGLEGFVNSLFIEYADDNNEKSGFSY